ncbi:MAG TPA: hypothetical protein PLK41_04480 [Defluviitoga tunisiensis]|nr:hypothetical protein [bacterium]HPP10227.1 hypothetical protein [Defluviitoga tunisiensis]
MKFETDYKILTDIREILKEIRDLLRTKQETKTNNKGFEPTGKQIGFIKFLAKKKNISDEFLKEILKEICKVEKIEDIKTRQDFDELIKFLTKD